MTKKTIVAESTSTCRDESGNHTHFYEVRFSDGTAWTRSVFKDAEGRRTVCVVSILPDGTQTRESRCTGASGELHLTRNTLTSGGAWTEEVRESRENGESHWRWREIVPARHDHSKVESISAAGTTTLCRSMLRLADGGQRHEETLSHEPGGRHHYKVLEWEPDGTLRHQFDAP